MLLCSVPFWSRYAEGSKARLQNKGFQPERSVVAGRLLRVTGKLQRDGQVVHIIAQDIEDISHLLDRLVEPQNTPVNTPNCNSGATHSAQTERSG